MDTPPDKLFHDKLTAYQRPAPTAAWQRIEKGLDRSRGFGIYFKAAVAVLVLAIAGFLTWSAPMNNNKSSEITSSNKPEHSNQENKAAETVPPEGFEKPTEDKTIAIQSIEDDPVPISQSKRIKNNIKKTVLETSQDPPADELSNDESEVQLQEEINTIDVTAFEMEEISSEISSRKIVYSIEHAQNRFLKKKALSLKETEKERVKNKKITEVAYGVAQTLKNSEIGLGELRQIKDEFFALDFLAGNDKTTKNRD